MITNHKYQSSKLYGLVALLLIIISSLLLSGCSNTQAAPKVYQVGILSGLDYFAPTIDDFKAGMADLTEASLEAKTVTKGTNIPVVFAFSFIEGVALVKSVHEPGGNISVMRLPGPDIALKRFEVIREIAPRPNVSGYLISAATLLSPAS